MARSQLPARICSRSPGLGDLDAGQRQVPVGHAQLRGSLVGGDIVCGDIVCEEQEKAVSRVVLSSCSDRAVAASLPFPYTLCAMSLLEIDALEKSFGGQVLFGPFSGQISPGDRIALIGDNGVGKSTLLSILGGLEEPSAGRVHRRQGIRTGLLPQIARLDGGGTLYEAMQEAFRDLLEAQAELRSLEKMLQESAEVEALHRYDELLQRFESGDGYSIDARIRSVLAGLGFAPETFDRPVGILSGGEEARAALGRLLLRQPDLLLLDEPTNHLDFAALDWLEETLLEFSGGLVLVSHDRHLLDRVANRVWEIAFGELSVYRGSYSTSRATRDAERARRLELFEEQQATIDKHKEFIRRNLAGQKHGQAKDRERKLERLEKDLVEEPRDAKRISLRIGMGAASGKRVLTTAGLVIGFDSPLVACPDLVVYRGERVAIVGPNGCGKTSFLLTATGRVAPLDGKITLGHGVKTAMYSQTQEGLHENATVLDTIMARSGLSISQTRGLLGRYLFSGDDVHKKMKALSGGERSRVALALLSLMEGNCLLLDEPTNHLDLASQEILEEALLAYEGTILLVSHDRALLEAVATQVWEVRDGVLEVFPCGWSRYKERTAVAAAPMSAPPTKKEIPLRGARPRLPKLDKYVERRRAEREKTLEGTIEALEAEQRRTEEELLEASAAGDAARIGELGREHERIRLALRDAVTAWEAWASQGRGQDEP